MSQKITKESIQKINLRRPLTEAQLNFIIENWSDDDEEIEQVTILPPETVDENTDDECLDEDIIPMNDDVGIVQCPGTFEVTTLNKETGEKLVCNDDDSKIIATTNVSVANTTTDININLQLASASTTTPKKLKIQEPVIKPKLAYKSFGAPKWTKKRNRQRQFNYELSPNENGLNACQEDIYNKLKDKSPGDLFSLFYDDEVLNLIVDETNRYAEQKKSNFKINQIGVKQFLGILVFSGFHTVPAISDYWSSNPALGVPFVKSCMSRNRFDEIKKFLHFSNNGTNSDKSDKFVKLRPLYELINKKFIQFGIWSKDLSVDKQMIPYFGQHSCKMYIRGKPIRFGYKLWSLCSASGYLYSCMPYAGSSDSYNKEIGLGADVVLRLLENVAHPTHHVVYFDNFFNSYHLMCLLTEKKFCATGTLRSNRMCGATIKTGKQLAKGDHDFQFDTNNKILFCRWQDNNNEVTIATNFDQIEPVTIAKRWQKAKKNKDRKIVEAGRFVNFPQPLLLHNYHKAMGGVDLHDNAAQNYYINIRSKKWYWPLFIATMSSSIVNAWKLSCFIRRYKNQHIIPQKTFRVEIAKFLMMTPSDVDILTGDDNVPMEGDFPSSESPSAKRSSFNY